MRSPLVRIEFFETYYYANVIHNVLKDTSAFMRSLHEWHEDQAASLFLPPFQKWSVLHSFSYFIIEGLIHEAMEEAPKSEKLWIEHALSYHNIEATFFQEWLTETNRDRGDIDAVYDYHCELKLTGVFEELVIHLANEVFFLLFPNRALLARLNGYVAGIVDTICMDDLCEEQLSFLSKDGVPARASIPTWVRRAVFFRDRGQCACCSRDLSGLISLGATEHFDHIIPLALGGINDVTNIQLLCESCNLAKGKKELPVSNLYEPWYS
jgi:hypothetical protein